MHHSATVTIHWTGFRETLTRGAIVMNITGDDEVNRERMRII